MLRTEPDAQDSKTVYFPGDPAMLAPNKGLARALESGTATNAAD